MQHGHGREPGVSGCIWDLTVYRATNGMVWRDNLPCFNQVLVYAGQTVNDRLTPAGLRRLEVFEPRLARCRRNLDDKVEARINRRLALWCARRVEHLGPPEAKACNDVLERWLAGEATTPELETAWAAARASGEEAEVASGEEASRAASWASEAAWASVASGASEASGEEASRAASWAASWAAEASTAEAGDDALLAFLDDLIDQWEKIAADEGALAELDDPANYTATPGS